MEIWYLPKGGKKDQMISNQSGMEKKCARRHTASDWFIKCQRLHSQNDDEDF